MRGGVTVSILTGRLYSGTRAVAEHLGLDGPVGCVDGSHLVNAQNHATLLHMGIRGDHAQKLRDSLLRCGPATFLFAEDSIVHDDQGAPHLPYVSTWSTKVLRTERVHDHDFWASSAGVTAVVAVGEAAQVQGAERAITESLGDAAQVVIFPVKRVPGQWGLVARAAGGTKGSALRWLADHHGYAMSDTVVVGDWLNDLSMFAAAGRAFAMGHAPDEVKRAATAALPETAAEGGGIARVVAEVFGIE